MVNTITPKREPLPAAAPGGPDPTATVQDRLETAKQGGPFVLHADVEGYLARRAQGEAPERPRTIEA